MQLLFEDDKNTVLKEVMNSWLFINGFDFYYSSFTVLKIKFLRNKNLKPQTCLSFYLYPVKKLLHVKKGIIHIHIGCF